MEWLNYHHLHYFWLVAREGSIAAAAERLQLAQPTISTQIRALEKSFDLALFDRSGRRLQLNDAGRVVYRYADDIFALGRELQDTMKGRPSGTPLKLNVGIADVLPKLVAHRLLAPALEERDAARITCYEGKSDQLLAQLSIHELDVVLTDAPISPHVSIKGFNHLLGECGITVFGVKKLAAKVRRRFPKSLDGAPWLLPTANTTLRRALDQWFDTIEVRPNIVGEFEDSALKKVFGQQGAGLFAAPSFIEKEICRQYDVSVAGRTEDVREQFYAISMERKVRHPIVLTLTNAARADLY
ncbi:MAG: transcriptional activator NhaR [Planctomycetota bacterium]|jgi:LysR family transcriptional activator of nhaA